MNKSDTVSCQLERLEPVHILHQSKRPPLQVKVLLQQTKAFATPSHWTHLQQFLELIQNHVPLSIRYISTKNHSWIKMFSMFLRQSCNKTLYEGTVWFSLSLLTSFRRYPLFCSPHVVRNLFILLFGKGWWQHFFCILHQPRVTKQSEKQYKDWADLHISPQWCRCLLPSSLLSLLATWIGLRPYLIKKHLPPQIKCHTTVKIKICAAPLNTKVACR